jgi:hypothetical protein
MITINNILSYEPGLPVNPSLLAIVRELTNKGRAKFYADWNPARAHGQAEVTIEPNTHGLWVVNIKSPSKYVSDTVPIEEIDPKYLGLPKTDSPTFEGRRITVLLNLEVVKTLTRYTRFTIVRDQEV